ncbi:hypothetical protein PL81_32745 [Streptomyces sp. RSD-27]|nr:hypothetical protein PL81_32745 [Streptomyces sp. RSD-27]
MRIARARDTADVHRQALDYASAVTAGLGAEMTVGRRVLDFLQRHTGLSYMAVTRIRPVWNALAKTTRGSTPLAEALRTHPAGRVLGLDARVARRARAV